MLLTAFEPFNGEPCNSSQQVAGHLLDGEGDDWVLHYRELPVTRFGAAEGAIAAITEYDPDLVIMLGQAGCRGEVTPERVAINLDCFHIPDNAGAQPRGECIRSGGPAGYFSTLPVAAVVDRLRSEGIAARVSNTAGLYVCNHVFYAVMHHLSEMEPAPMAGFIHLPRVRRPSADADDRDGDGLPLAVMGRAVRSAIRQCIAGTAPPAGGVQPAPSASV